MVGMNGKRRWLWGVLGLVVAVTVIFLQMRRQTETDGARAAAGSPDAKEEAAETGPPAGVGPALNKDKTESVTTEFREWFKKESAALNAINIDSDRKHSQLKQRATHLTAEESHLLLLTARKISAPSSEKILSTFLLVEGGLNTRQALADLMTSPLNTVTDAEAHSEDELVSVREKSLRVMAIEGLLSQAKNDPAARALLAKRIPDIEDPYIRDYARKGLEELERQ